MQSKKNKKEEKKEDILQRITIVLRERKEIMQTDRSLLSRCPVEPGGTSLRSGQRGCLSLSPVENFVCERARLLQEANVPVPFVIVFGTFRGSSVSHRLSPGPVERAPTVQSAAIRTISVRY